MLHPSTKKLIDRLSEMTSQRKIDWLQTDRPDALVYDTEGYRVILEGQPAALVLCDALGNELDRADPNELASTRHIDGGTYTEIIEDMRSDASRIARGTENAIAAVLGGLDLDGDGIPDVPAPVQLEAAPDGNIGETLDDIEDAVNEADAVEIEEINALEDVVDTLETDLESNLVDMEPDEPEAVHATAPVIPDISDARDIADLEMPDMPSAEEVVGQAEDVVEAALPDVDLPHVDADDAPDVGKAVADLADKVNGETISMRPDAVADNARASMAASTASLLTGAGAMGAIAAGHNRNHGTVEMGSAIQTPPEADKIADTIEEVSETTHTESGALTPFDAPVDALAAASTAAAPVHKISLSGLTEGTDDIPIDTAGYAAADAPETATVAVEAAEVLEDAPVETTRAATILAEDAITGEPPAPNDIEEQISDLAEKITSDPDAVGGMSPTLAPTVAAADEIHVADSPELDNIEAPAAPEAPTEEVSEDRAAQKAKPKRFNPWI